MTHKFIYNACNDTHIEMSIQSVDITWIELTEKYFNYLQACGFVLTREMFAKEVEAEFGEQ